MRRADESAVSTVVGAIVILAMLSLALVYVNAFHVPRQGAALEVQAAERAGSSLLRLASVLDAAGDAPITHDVPLQADPALPPLLSGIVLTPARSEGRVGLDASSTRMSISVVTDAPAGGVPGGDPTRVDLGAGRMRLFLLGNATAAQPVGALNVTVGGAYLPATHHRLEAVLLLADRAGASSALAPPSLSVERSGSLTSVAWRVPLLAGGVSETTGGAVAQVALRPGPEAQLGAGRVYQIDITVGTNAASAWRDGLDAVVGGHGFVNATFAGAPDAGTVTAAIVAPPGTDGATRGVELRLWAVRYEVSLAERVTG